MLGRAGQSLDRLEAGSARRVARHRLAMAAPTLPRVLDPALGPAHRRPPSGRSRNRRPRQDNGRGESPVGCSPHPRGAPEARHRHRRAHRLQAPAEVAPPALSDLADVPRQPPPRLGLHRLLHRAHRSPPRPLRPRRPRPPPPARRPLQPDRAPHRPLDRSADRERLSGRVRAALSPPRPRPDLRSAISAPREGHGNRGGFSRHRTARGRTRSRSGSSARSGASA
jgi:hypothetical protein